MKKKKGGGRLSKKARAAEAKRLKAKRSKAAKKGWLTRRATEAAKSRKTKPPLFEEPFFADNFEDRERFEEEQEYEEFLGIDSLYPE